MADPRATLAHLDAAFESALAPWRDGRDDLVVLFSGGVDSGLIAWTLRGRDRVVLATVGVAGAKDWDAARSAAEIVGLPWRAIEVGPSDVRAIAARFAAELSAIPPVARSVQIALALAIASAPGGTVLCGQGADELFLGYAHFRGLDAAALRARARDDLELLRDRDWPTSVRLAGALGRTIVAPYLSPEFVRAAEAVPLEERAPRETAKEYFRAWARSRGLPRAIADRPKRAMQFGSGIDRIARTIPIYPASGPRA